MRKIVLITGALLVAAITSTVAAGAPSTMSAGGPPALLVGTWEVSPGFQMPGGQSDVEDREVGRLTVRELEDVAEAGPRRA